MHVPFCARRCDYCAFATWTTARHLMDDVRGGVRARGRPSAALPPATSVFFGGGTPSLLPAELLVSILAAIHARRRRRGHGRVQPGDGDGGAARRLRAGRRHPAVVRRAVDGAARARRARPDARRRASVVRGGARWPATRASTSFNLDLIYGGAGESLDDWRRTLDAVLALEPPHVTAYALTVEPGTPLAADPARHPDDDDQADKYVLADRAAHRRGPGQLRDLQLGPARPRVPPQPPVLAPGRLPRHRLRRPLPRRRAAGGGTCARPSATSPPIDGGRVARRGRRDARPTTSAGPRACSSPLRTRDGVPAGALPADGASTAWSRCTATAGRAHGRRAACSPTRSPSACNSGSPRRVQIHPCPGRSGQDPSASAS